MKADQILPFRFIAAARHAPRFVGELENAMLKNLDGQEKIPGTTIVLVDVSGSMDRAISSKSDMTRMDCATGLAVLMREICPNCRVASFSNKTVEIPAYRGLGLVDAVLKSQLHLNTLLGDAVKWANQQSYDRLIIITDEQSQEVVGGPKGLGYVINVASNRNGVGYGPWVHIDGWSEKVVDFIREMERKVED